MPYTAHVDTFARDHLPPPEAQPEFLFDLPELQFPERLNCATELLDRARAAKAGATGRCVSAPGGPAGPTPSCSARPTASPTCWSTDCGLVPGNRVLLRAANKPMLVACWFAVMKAGGIAVATMPMLRAKELKQIIEKGAGRRSRSATQRCAASSSMLLPATPVLQRDRLLRRPPRPTAWRR